MAAAGCAQLSVGRGCEDTEGAELRA